MEITIVFEKQSNYDPKYKVRVVKVNLDDDNIKYFSQIVENDAPVFERKYSSKSYAIKKALEFDNKSWYKDIELLKNLGFI